MSQLISRRKMLGGVVKTSVGLVVFNQLAFDPRPVVALSQAAQTPAARFQSAYQRLDEYIARHLSEVGAPGMTLALADRSGLLRSSQYGFADVKTGTRVSLLAMAHCNPTGPSPLGANSVKHRGLKCRERPAASLQQQATWATTCRCF